MNYIDIHNVEFKTSGKDTTCTITYSYKTPLIMGGEVIMGGEAMNRIIHRFRKDDSMNGMNWISATARCKDGDEYDLDKGRWIAKDKATLRLLELDTKIAFSVNGYYSKLMDVNRKRNAKSLKKSFIITSRLKYKY